MHVFTWQSVSQLCSIPFIRGFIPCCLYWFSITLDQIPVSLDVNRICCEQKNDINNIVQEKRNEQHQELRSLLALEEKQLIIAPWTLHYPTPTPWTLHYPTPTPWTLHYPTPIPSTLHYPTPTPSTLHYHTPTPSTLHYPTPTPSTLHYPTPAPSTLHYPTPTPSTLHYPTPPCPSLPSWLSKVCDISKPSYAVTFFRWLSRKTYELWTTYKIQSTCTAGVFPWYSHTMQ